MAVEYDFHSRNYEYILCSAAETRAENKICFLNGRSITIQR